MRRAQIRGPECSRQTVRRVPDNTYRFRLVAYHLHGQHGSKDLLAEHELPSAECQRKVPWDDGSDDARWFPADQRKLALVGRRDLTGLLVRQLAVEAEAADQCPQFDLVRIPNRLAHLETDQQGDFFAMFFDQIGEVLEDLAAGSWMQSRPGTMIKCSTRCSHSSVCITLLRPGELHQLRAVPRSAHNPSRAMDRCP